MGATGNHLGGDRFAAYSPDLAVCEELLKKTGAGSRFIVTGYSGGSFFARHAYFSGAEEPCPKLKRALHADADEAAWRALYSTHSRAIPRPALGKIAVKVIHHCGEDVLRVFGV